MFETKDLLLDKAKPSDWVAMYKNVWSQSESAKYMAWRVTTNEDEAKIRMQKTIEFQKTNDTYLVYEKVSGEAIGFAGIEQLGPYTYQEAGICLGPKFVGKGYGKQIVMQLIQYCKKELGAKEFIYSTRDNNEASIFLYPRTTGARASVPFSFHCFSHVRMVLIDTLNTLCVSSSVCPSPQYSIIRFR